MRGRSFSGKQGGSSCKEGMEVDKLDKLKEEPHLSGAYIRSLVKQLTASRTKDSMNHKDTEVVIDEVGDGDGFTVAAHHQNNFTKIGQLAGGGGCFVETQQPPQHKKQVRRRLHTSRPYQERLLNMAEARREIVTALKFHRAAKKKQANNNQQLVHPPSPQPSPPSPLEQEAVAGKLKSNRRNPRTYAASASGNSNTTNFSNYASFPGVAFSSPPQNPHPYSSYWPLSQQQVAPLTPSSLPENINLTLPDQTLGLNLNLHEFNNLDTSLYLNSNSNSPYTSSSIYYSSPSTSSSSPVLSVATESEVPFNYGGGAAEFISQEAGPPHLVADLHQAMDDEEMAEIRTLGEQHQMEWSDTLNLVTSAWWFKFLNSMEIGPENEKEELIDGYRCHPFDQAMMGEFPAWLNANESFLQQVLLDDYCSSDDYLQDPALPCMDIGEIEGIDGDWLA